MGVSVEAVVRACTGKVVGVSVEAVVRVGAGMLVGVSTVNSVAVLWTGVLVMIPTG